MITKLMGKSNDLLKRITCNVSVVFVGPLGISFGTFW